jgi:hypothetical protein
MLMYRVREDPLRLFLNLRAQLRAIARDEV